MRKEKTKKKIDLYQTIQHLAYTAQKLTHICVCRTSARALAQHQQHLADI